MPPSDTIYITTPIYYVNDKPHIGHAYTTIVCDVYARFMRLAGADVFFLTGTDEHGVKVEKSAAEKKTDPQTLADENSSAFQNVLSIFGLTNDDFIRTTQRRHVAQVKQIVSRLIEQGDVYLDEYEGWYDEGQEEFIPETRAREQDFKSTVSGKPLVRMKEANYFFRLSAYQDRLQEWYEQNPGCVRPEARRNEMLARLREGLNDIPVSRTSFSWGIPVPGHEEHVLWVWLDALSNYITALGVIDGSCVEHPERARCWPATYHVIGKEILFFHALFWPAMLMALELPLPKCIYAHSFWISEGQKMSKSLGNFIDLPTIQTYVETYGLDTWRYYMATQGPLSATDSDFAAAHFHEVYTADLVNTFGNCASRVTAMIGKYFDGVIPDEHDDSGARITFDEFDWPTLCAEAEQQSRERMAQLDLAGSIAAGLSLVRKVDSFINDTEPFKLAKDDANRAQVGAILYQSLEALRIASCLLWCVLPEKTEDFWQALGISISLPEGASSEGATDESARDSDTLADLVRWGALQPGATVERVALYPRVEEALAAGGV